MEIINVIVAAVAAFAFGAVWYMTLSGPWMAASEVAVDESTNKPANASDPIPYITSLIGCVIVAGMMRHVFELSGIDTVIKGIVAGFGIGLFLVTPWIATFNGFEGKPKNLTLINGGYATFGCAVIGLVLTLF